MDNQTLNIKPKNGYGFIYCYTSPSGKQYIGQTTTTLKERAKKNAKGYKGCKYFYNAIQKYGQDNFQVEILEEVPAENLTEIESQYIVDRDATNREKGYNIITDYCNFLKIFNRIPVYSYDMYSGRFLEAYDSAACAERAMGAYCGSIRRALNNPMRHVHQRLQRTEKVDCTPVIGNNLQPTAKQVYQYDSTTGQFLYVFDSIRAAARATSCPRSTIMWQIKHQSCSKQWCFRDFKVDNVYDGSSTITSSEGTRECAERSLQKDDLI